jgi:hypothetical protein
MSDHLRLKHNAGRDEFAPPPAPAPTPTEAKADPTPYLGPVRSLPASNGRLAPSKNFAPLGVGLDAALEADSAIRSVAAHEAMSSPESLHRRLDQAVRNNELSKEDAARYWQLKYPAINPDTLKPFEAKS